VRRVLTLGALLDKERADVGVARPVLAPSVIAEGGSWASCAVAGEGAVEVCEDCAGERDSLLLWSSLSESESESVVESSEDAVDDAVDDADRGLFGIRPGSPSLGVSDPELEEYSGDSLMARRFWGVIRDGERLCLAMALD
jgi:hypothetical protein